VRPQQPGGDAADENDAGHAVGGLEMTVLPFQIPARHHRDAHEHDGDQRPEKRLRGCTAMSRPGTSGTVSTATSPIEPRTVAVAVAALVAGNGSPHGAPQQGHVVSIGSAGNSSLHATHRDTA
jgi:hypothetical protein